MSVTGIREIPPHVQQLAEHYGEQIMRRAVQHNMPMRDEATAALFAALACLHTACVDDVEEFKLIAKFALDAVLDVPPPIGDEQ